MEEQQTLDYLNNEVMQHNLIHCPCGYFIEKVSGCNYLKCSCGIELCYIGQKMKYIAGEE